MHIAAIFNKKLDDLHMSPFSRHWEEIVMARPFGIQIHAVRQQRNEWNTITVRDRAIECAVVILCQVSCTLADAGGSTSVMPGCDVGVATVMPGMAVLLGRRALRGQQS